MGAKTGQFNYAGLLTLLMVCALFLTSRIIYLYLADAERFPIDTVKIAANYQHITRKQIEIILSNYLNSSFFCLPVRRLHVDLGNLDWSDKVYIERIWPGTLKISLVEKAPIAIWNDSLITETGEVFNVGKDHRDLSLPNLIGPENQQTEVLQIYEKLSKLLTSFGLQIASLKLCDNQAWELSLSNGIDLYLGKQDIEKRLLRFCRAYPSVFAEKPEQLTSVDLRYARGMAVKWKGLSNVQNQKRR